MNFLSLMFTTWVKSTVVGGGKVKNRADMYKGIKSKVKSTVVGGKVKNWADTYKGMTE